MPYYLFHQNMKAFGGAQADRLTAYRAAFQRVRTDLGHGSQILAAGFTEVTNNQAAAQAFSGAAGLCAQLGVRYYGTIRCGGTALGRTEYLSLGFASGVVVERLGRLFIDVSGPTAASFIDVAPTGNKATWAANLPARASTDFRGIVIARIRRGTRRILIGYVHNVYSLEPQRMTFALQIPRIVGQLANWVGPTVPVYIGGDFNLLPPAGGSRGTTRTGLAYAQAVGAETYYNATTWGRHLYDFWFTSNPREGDLPRPSVNRITMDGAANSGQPLSDHMAILLQIA